MAIALEYSYCGLYYGSGYATSNGIKRWMKDVILQILTLFLWYMMGSKISPKCLAMKIKKCQLK